MLLAGLLAIILWFEVASASLRLIHFDVLVLLADGLTSPLPMLIANYFMSGTEKAAFIVAGLVETFLLVASILG